MTTRPTRRQAAKAASDGHIKALNGEIFAAREPLQKLLTKEFPVKTAFGLAKLVNTLQGHLQNIESVRSQLVRKHGKEDTTRKGQFTVPKDCPEFDAWAKEMNELLALEVDVAASKVELPEMVNGKPLEISAASLIALEKFVVIPGIST